MTDSDSLLLREALAEALPQLEPIEPAPHVRAGLRARIATRAGAAKANAQDASLTIHAEQGRWHTIATGLQVKLLHQDESVKSFLLKIAPGAEVPAHDHPADEECLVVAGEVQLGDLRLGAGGYHLARKGSLHLGNLRSEQGAMVLIHTSADAAPRLPAAMLGR